MPIMFLGRVGGKVQERICFRVEGCGRKFLYVKISKNDQKKMIKIDLPISHVIDEGCYFGLFNARI